MTLGECVQRADALRPNTASEAEKARWVLELEGELTGTFFPRYEGPAPEDCPRRWPEDRTKTLSAGGPYEEMYVQWLLAWIELQDRETGAYNLHMSLANRWQDEFKKEWNRTRQRKRGAAGADRTDGSGEGVAGKG